MYNPLVTFSTMEFDLKVVEPEEILIKEIYIKLYKENEIEKTLSSNDGINKVGPTEDICFRDLNPQTRYRLDFVFDYFEQDYENDGVVIYSYSFTTMEDLGIAGEFLNYSFSNGIISGTAKFSDDSNLTTSLDVYLRKGDEIIQHYDMSYGLHVGINKCEFGLLLPNEKYTISLHATFEYGNKLYEDFLLNSFDFNIDDYFDAPVAKFSNVKVEDNVVTFDVYITDQQKALKDCSIVVVNSSDVILHEINTKSLSSVVIGVNRTFQFEQLFPNSSYALKVIADYQTPEELVYGATLTEYQFKTEMFSIIPQATITEIEETNETINFTYDVKDPCSLITSLRCEIRNLDNEIVQTMDLTDSMSKNASLNKTSDLAFFKINFIADYTHLFYIKKDVVIGSFEHLESQQQDFLYGSTSEAYPNIEIKKYIGESQICSIPKMIDGRKVVSIGRNAFSESNVTRVLIPDTITTIDVWAFQNCETLQSVTIGNGVTAISQEAFSGCSSLKEIIIPNSVSLLGNEAFYECVSLTSATIGGNNLPEIGSRTFFNCTALTSVIIGYGITSIGYSAFFGCSSLKSIEIPDGVATIGYSAFEGCSNLDSIIIPINVTSIKSGVFKDCYGLVIYCEVASKPSGWDSAWVDKEKYSITVHWGYTKEV